MRTDLLLRLADLLEADAANPNGVCFDLSDWSHPITENFEVQTEVFDKDLEVIPVSCQTAACAIGLAAISGAFKDEGLTWKIEPSFDDRTKGFLVPVMNNDSGYIGFGAAMRLFGIDDLTVYSLFDPDHYPHDKRKKAEGELEVARRIRAVVAGTFTPTSDPYANREAEY